VREHAFPIKNPIPLELLWVYVKEYGLSAVSAVTEHPMKERSRSMDSSETKVGGAVLLKPAGRLDLSNADAFKDALSAALSSAQGALIVDLSGVEYISSAGLRSLMIVFKASKGESKGFAVAALQPLVLEIFTISRFNTVFPLFNTLREAVEKLTPDALAEFDSTHAHAH
jgi:anti-sigma B factor antagonist/stage II sporulation protein AA (anti-sigma F factor antagonist)